MDTKSDTPIDVKINNQRPASINFNGTFDDSSSSCSLLSWKGSISSINRSLCRICQSETGTMIRPCDCAGTMGKIHEHCLNEWVRHSRKECCEICKADYAKSSNTLLPLREWKKPDISSSNWIELIALTGLIFSNFYIISLFDERQFIYRLFVERLPPREPDACRIIFLFVLSAFLLCTIVDLLQRVKLYFRKQCKVRFVNNTELNAEALVLADLNNKTKSTATATLQIEAAANVGESSGTTGNNGGDMRNGGLAPSGSGTQRPQIILNMLSAQQNRTIVIETGVDPLTSSNVVHV